MNNISFMLNILINTPWKALKEFGMLIFKPFALFYLKIVNHVNLGRSAKFYGFPKIYRHRQSNIEIGNNFENRNWWSSNPLGVNHPTIICTWKKGAQIKIGNNVGISGGSIVASKKIEIGDGTLIGANCVIIDTDFHPIKSKNRRYDRENIRTKPIKIGRNVFIGTNCIILKGAKIPDNAVVPAGSIIR